MVDKVRDDLKRSLRSRMNATINSVCVDFEKSLDLGTPMPGADCGDSAPAFDSYYDNCRQLVGYIANTMDTSPAFAEQMNYVILASRNNASKTILDSVLKKDVWFRRRDGLHFDERVDTEDSTSFSTKLAPMPQTLGKRKISQAESLSKRHRLGDFEDDFNLSEEEKTDTGKELLQAENREAADKQNKPNWKRTAASNKSKTHREWKSSGMNEDSVGDLCLFKPQSPGELEAIKMWLQNFNECIDAKYCEPPTGYICSWGCTEHREQMSEESDLRSILERVDGHLEECENPQCELRTRFTLQKTNNLIELKQFEIGEVRRDLKDKRVNSSSGKSSQASALDLLKKTLQFKKEELTALEKKKTSLCAKMDSIRLDWRDELTDNTRNAASHYVRKMM
ncbi:hypothetical protein PF010_g13112 [Phytophthora fragariae]|uniref:Uncharacterized protein n=1 Tax=Phytophthora fragariae TaxID=53985 RepID=A0A6G0L0R5_9STRA|nr:hypothetical protein PF010_g13112 [Phytophthora fragariae]